MLKKRLAFSEPFLTGKNILLNVPTFLLYDNHLLGCGSVLS